MSDCFVLSSLCLVLFLFFGYCIFQTVAACALWLTSVTLPRCVRAPPPLPLRGSLPLLPLCRSAAHVRGSLRRCNGFLGTMVTFLPEPCGGGSATQTAPTAGEVTLLFPLLLPSDRLPALAAQTHACLQRNEAEKQGLSVSPDLYTRIRNIVPLGSECAFYKMANGNKQKIDSVVV